MRIDFYQLTRDPAEQVAAMLAERCLDAGERLLLVASDEAQRSKISRALWQHKPTSFLAHGGPGEDEALQPILLSGEYRAANEARFVLIADGQWHDDALGFDRAFFLFAPAHLDHARETWRALGNREEAERHFWKQDGGRWREGP